MGMGMVDHLQIQALVPNVFLRSGKVRHIHHEGDLGPFSRREPFQMRRLGRVEGREFLCSLKRHDVLDSIDLGDGSLASCQEPAAFVGGELTRVGDHVVEDSLGDLKRGGHWA